MHDLSLNRKKPMPQDDGSSWSKLAGIGFEFIAAILMFGGIGWWLDARLGTKPWVFIGGVIVGFGIGLWLMIRAAGGAFHD